MLSTCRRDYIRKTSKGKFGVYSESGKLLGEHPSREKALAQLRAVEYNKHKNDNPPNMGQLELPRGGDYQAESIGTVPEGDSPAVMEGGTDPGLNSDPLQPHELPERRSNPHHAPDPLREHELNGEPTGVEHRYLEVEQDAPAVENGGTDLGEKTWPECDPLGDLRAAERIGEPKADDPAPGRLPREQDNAPFQAGANGDPAPNPSGDKTLSTRAMGPTAEMNAGVAVLQQPDETNGSQVEGESINSDDEPGPQYEMLSTPTRLHMNEGWEPNYFEEVSGQNGGPDNAYSKTDPAGDDDWLKEIGARPTKNGEL